MTYVADAIAKEFFKRNVISNSLAQSQKFLGQKNSTTEINFPVQSKLNKNIEYQRIIPSKKEENLQHLS